MQRIRVNGAAVQRKRLPELDLAPSRRGGSGSSWSWRVPRAGLLCAHATPQGQARALL
jgi:hypothetical protein